MTDPVSAVGIVGATAASLVVATTPSVNAAIKASSTPFTLRANLEDAARKGATDVPALIKGLVTLDPAMVPKSLVASTTPWGTIVGTGVGWAVAHYGLACTAASAASANCWSDTTVSVVTGALVLLGTAAAAYVMRWFTIKPIGSVLPQSTPPT